MALAPEAAPFAALLAGPGAGGRDAPPGGSSSPARCGATSAISTRARILAGWPALGVEIDEKTLPQEVRYDEIGGVSYTKGCYTGQETVARLHFRGHTNRELRGLAWREPGAPEGRTVARAARRKSAPCARRSRWTTARWASRIVRREIEPGAEVVAGGRERRW